MDITRIIIRVITAGTGIHTILIMVIIVGITEDITIMTTDGIKDGINTDTGATEGRIEKCRGFIYEARNEIGVP